MRPALALWDAFLARVLALLDRDCGPVADDDEIEPGPSWTWQPKPWWQATQVYGIAYADDDDQDES